MRGFLSFVACCVLLSAQAFAQNASSASSNEPAAYVISVTGLVTVQLSPQDAWVPATVDMALSKQARLKTSPGSSIHLGFEDKVMFEVFVAQSTELSIQDLLENQKFLIEKGTIFVRAKSLDQKINLEVDVPNCVIGVRGTEFEVESLKTQTDVSGYEGQVTTQGKDATGKVMSDVVRVDGGFGTRILDQQNPTPVIQLSKERFDHWIFLRHVMFAQREVFKKDHPNRFKKLFEQKDEAPKLWKHLEKPGNNDAAKAIAGFLVQQGIKSIGSRKDHDDDESSGSQHSSSTQDAFTVHQNK